MSSLNASVIMGCCNQYPLGQMGICKKYFVYVGKRITTPHSLESLRGLSDSGFAHRGINDSFAEREGFCAMSSERTGAFLKARLT